jgi:hypothetical protein
LAGNCNENSVTITVDTTAPTLEITSPMNGSVINIDNVTVTWTANDATTRMDGYEVSLDGADWTLANGTTWSMTGLADGGHIVNVRAYDLVGNFSESGVNFTVDMVKPSLEIISPSNGSYDRTGSVTVTWTAVDEGAGLDRYEVSTDGAERNVVSRTQHTFEMADGVHTIHVRAYDAAGNFNESSVTVYRRHRCAHRGGDPGW